MLLASYIVWLESSTKFMARISHSKPYSFFSYQNETNPHALIDCGMSNNLCHIGNYSRKVHNSCN